MKANERLSPELFDELKHKIKASQYGRRDNKRGWKRRLCREYGITFYSILHIIEGKMVEPPYTGDFKGNDKEYTNQYSNGGVQRCSFCNTFITKKGEFETDDGESKYCSGNCMKLSLDFRQHEAKEPHPIRLGRSHRVIGIPKQTFNKKSRC